MPVKKVAGDSVIGATINKSGSFRYKANRVGADTALAQIVKLVQEAQNSKAPGQLLADKASQWLVLIAIVVGKPQADACRGRRTRCISRRGAWRLIVGGANHPHRRIEFGSKTRSVLLPSSA